MIETLLALGIVGILAYQFNGLFNQSTRAQKSLALSSDRESIKRLLLRSISCADSFTPGTCPKSGGVDLYRPIHGVPAVYIPALGRRFGEWVVRAECSVDNSGLLVRAVRMRDGAPLNSQNPADFLESPLGGGITTWTSPQSLLFPMDLPLCYGESNASGSFYNPNFDSKWVSYNDSLVIPHNLGTTDLYADLQFRTAAGVVHNRRFSINMGGPYYVEQFNFQYVQLELTNKNAATIKTWAVNFQNGINQGAVADSDFSSVRLRLYKTPH